MFTTQKYDITKADSENF